MSIGNIHRTSSHFSIDIAKITMSSLIIRRGNAISVTIDSGVAGSIFDATLTGSKVVSLTLPGTGNGTLFISTNEIGSGVLSVTDDNVVLTTARTVVVQ
jgi:hypothetical protein